MEKFRNILVIIGGINFLLFGLFHIAFWFDPVIDWKNELPKLTELNSNIMQLLNIAISVFFLAFGFMMLCYRREILNSTLGRALLFIFALFWLVRLVGEIVFPGGFIIAGVIFFISVLIYSIPVIIWKK
ncbi:MAG: hypothetical protein LBI15_04475 [Dysgonamonadaceae bacterium]|nr:hypothetical protein [Dysgonamonadaceae bacterium]